MQLGWAGREELIEALSVLDPSEREAIVAMGDRLANRYGIEPKRYMMRLVPAFMHITGAIRSSRPADDAQLAWELAETVAQIAGYEL